MGLFRLFYGLSVVFLAVNASNIHEQNGDSDLGEPLYLTKYIENGDIETVSKKMLYYKLTKSKNQLTVPISFKNCFCISQQDFALKI